MSESSTAIKALTQGDGYTILPGLISAELAESVRAFILDHTDECEVNTPGDINLRNLLHRDRQFHELVTHPGLLSVAQGLLGDDCKLAAYSAKILMPDCNPGRAHVDYPYWAMDPGMPASPALMMQVIWMLQPFSEENGGTWVVPGSQLYQEKLDLQRFDNEAIQVTGNAGDAILSHGLLWHKTAINHAQSPRVALLINYSQISIRQMREMGPFSDEFLEAASPALLKLLPVHYDRSLRARFEKNF